MLYPRQCVLYPENYVLDHIDTLIPLNGSPVKKSQIPEEFLRAYAKEFGIDDDYYSIPYGQESMLTSTVGGVVSSGCASDPNSSWSGAAVHAFYKFYEPDTGANIHFDQQWLCDGIPGKPDRIGFVFKETEPERTLSKISIIKRLGTDDSPGAPVPMPKTVVIQGTHDGFEKRGKITWEDISTNINLEPGPDWGLLGSKQISYESELVVPYRGISILITEWDVPKNCALKCGLYRCRIEFKEDKEYLCLPKFESPSGYTYAIDMTPFLQKYSLAALTDGITHSVRTSVEKAISDALSKPMVCTIPVDATTPKYNIPPDNRRELIIQDQDHSGSKAQATIALPPNPDNDDIYHVWNFRLNGKTYICPGQKSHVMMLRGQQGGMVDISGYSCKLTCVFYGNAWHCEKTW